MKKYVVLKLIGLAILTLITLFIISFMEVALYSYFVNPGHDFSIYEAHAQVSAPYVSGIFGFIIFFLVARYWKKKAFANVTKLVFLFPLTYVLLDLTIILLAGLARGDELASVALIFGLANGAKFLGSYLGYKLTKK